MNHTHSTMPNSDISFDDAYRLTLWLRGFYKRHFNVPSLKSAHEHAFRALHQDDEGNRDEDRDREAHDVDDAMPMQRGAGATWQPSTHDIPPPQQVVQLMTTTGVTPPSSHSIPLHCCCTSKCNSVLSVAVPGRWWLGIGTEGGTAPPTEDIPRCRACVHNALEWTMDGPHGENEIRLVPSHSYHGRGGGSSLHVRDDAVACAGRYVGVFGAYPVSLTVQSYTPAISGVTRREMDEDRHGGLRTMLLGGPQRCALVFRSITIYGVAGPSSQEVSDMIATMLLQRQPVLERLWLGGFDGGAVDMSLLSSALVNTDVMRELILEDCLGSIATAKGVLRSIAGKKNLRRLSLRNNVVVQDCTVELAQCMTTSCPALTSLDIALCGFDGRCWNRVMEALPTSAPTTTLPHLLHLDLSHNELLLQDFGFLATTTGESHTAPTDSIAEEGTAALRFYNGLVSLDLSGNPLTSRRSAGPQPPAQHVAYDNPVTALMQLVGATFSHCARLRLNDTDICQHSQPTTSSGKKALVTSNGASGSTMKRLCKQWAQNVMAAFQATRSLPTWIGTTATRSNDGLMPIIFHDAELALGGCALSTADAKGALYGIQTLMSTALCERVDSAEAGSLMSQRCFRVALTLYATSCASILAAFGDRALQSPLSCIVLLDLRTCDLGQDGATVLSSAFERNAPIALELLNLSDNSLAKARTTQQTKSNATASASRVDGVVALCRSLRSSVCPNLRALDLSFNELDQFKPLCTMLMHSSQSLGSLNLSGNAAISGADSEELRRRNTMGFLVSSHSARDSVPILPSAPSSMGRPPYADVISAIHTKLSRANRAEGGEGGQMATFHLGLRQCGLAAAAASQLLANAPITLRLFL